MAQVVQHLSSKCESLSSNPSTIKNWIYKYLINHFSLLLVIYWSTWELWITSLLVFCQVLCLVLEIQRINFSLKELIVYRGDRKTDKQTLQCDKGTDICITVCSAPHKMGTDTLRDIWTELRRVREDSNPSWVWAGRKLIWGSRSSLWKT
jgi:hypothetical protein